MVVEKNKDSHPWWFDSHNKSNSNRSSWLQTTLAELDEKTKTMLKLIDEDADSFAQRAEMYYKKRPELVSMVEDFYRTHRSLAERYDQAKSEPANRHLSSPFSSPLSFTKYRLDKSMSLSDKAYDSYSEVYEEETDESEVDDPEEEEESPKVESYWETKEDAEVTRLKEEVRRLRLENEAQRAELEEKDEEKREVIRQLTLAMDLIRDENVRRLQKKPLEKEKHNEFAKLKQNFLGRLFGGFGKTPVNLVAV